MIACYFRFVDAHNKPTGYIGFAVAQNREHLFWTIDQYGDPFRCQTKPVESASYCKFQEIDEDQENDDFYIQESEYNFDGSEPMCNEDGWKKPNWKGVMSEEKETMYKILLA